MEMHFIPFNVTAFSFVEGRFSLKKEMEKSALFLDKISS